MYTAKPERVCAKDGRVHAIARDSIRHYEKSVSQECQSNFQVIALDEGIFDSDEIKDGLVESQLRLSLAREEAVEQRRAIERAEESIRQLQEAKLRLEGQLSSALLEMQECDTLRHQVESLESIKSALESNVTSLQGQVSGLQDDLYKCNAAKEA